MEAATGGFVEAEGHSALDATTRDRIASLSINTKDSVDDHAALASDASASDTAAAPPPASRYEQQLRLATQLAGNARPTEALDVLGPLLARRPEDPRALCLQGRCLAAGGAKAQALAAFAGAISSDPGHVESLLGCAALYRESGMLPEALASLEKAHALAEAAGGDADSGCSPGAPAAAPPDYDDASQLAARARQALALTLTDLGTQMKLGGARGWKERYERAVAVCPECAPAHYNLGVAAGEAGDAEEAVQRYTRAVRLEPRYAEAWCNLAVLHRAAGRLEEAVAANERAYEAAPELEPVRLNLAAALTERGNALRGAGDHEGGVRAYERALALAPRHVEALYNLGVAFTEARQLDKAVFMYEMALAAAPRCAEAHNNLGVIHRELGNMERAARCYAAALEARPTYPQGLNNLAVIYTQQGRAQEALNLLRAATLADPRYAEAHNNLGVLQRDVGAAAAAVASYERCCELDPGNRNAGQNRLLALNYVHPGESDLVCRAHREWGRRFQDQQHSAALPPLRLADVDADPRRPLVVGYISPDLFTHSVSYFAEAPLTWHHPSRVRQVVYSVCLNGDAKTERLRGVVAAAGGAWRDAARWSEAELAAAVRRDKVDVLVELTGHTANNRLGTMALRPAPVQVTWIGYPNSTGLEAVQYRLTDALCDPADSRQSFAEELVRLPGCFLCYAPPPDAPPIAPLPALRNGFLTFGSFNALAKQTPEVLRAWARLLRALPCARLVLKNKPFADEAVRQQYWRAFEECGVGRERVDLLPLAPATRDHLAQYSLMDVALDPWPYAGTTTTAEALYMGVPCLTLAGGCHAHNVGVSLLAAVGLHERWVARSVDEYVDRAVQLSADVAWLAELRAQMRARVAASPLCDAPRFVAGLEETYQGLWARWLAEQRAEEAAAAAPAPGAAAGGAGSPRGSGAPGCGSPSSECGGVL